MKASQGAPASKVMRNPGTRQVDTKTANTPPNPMTDAQGPGGPN